MHGRADFQNPENSGEICLTHQTLFLNEEALKNLSLSRNRNSKPEKKKAERCIHPASIKKWWRIFMRIKTYSPFL